VPNIYKPKINVMKIIMLICFALLSLSGYADGPVISGNIFSYPNDIEEYTVTWDQWDNTYETYANVTWTVNGGTVISSDKHSITIQWNSLPGYLDGSATIEIVEDLGGQAGSQQVTLTNETQSPSDFCSGILGPAKVFIDFGAGSNPGSALSVSNISYQYNANCALVQDEYTVRNSLIACRSLWHNIPNDHTGNTNGYFLMVNAAKSKGSIYQTSITGLTPSFRYEFSAWCGNLYNIVSNSAQNPKIKFEIYDNGNLIASSGEIEIGVSLPNFTWQKIGFMFDLPFGVNSIDIVISSTRKSKDEGNDFAIDDISFAPCYPGIIASFSSTSIVDIAHTCLNGTVNLYSSWPSIIPFTNPSFQWQRSPDNGYSWNDIPGATSINYIKIENTSGIYQYRIRSYETANPSLSVTSNAIIYYVQKLVVDPRTTYFYSCPGVSPSGQLPPGQVRFENSNPQELYNLHFTYLWSPSTYMSNPIGVPGYVNLPVATNPPVNGAAAPNNVYNYTLTVTNTEYGCTGSNTQTASVYVPRPVAIPNAFTPEPNSHTNTLFRPLNIQDYPGSEFWVWNRYGNNVFYSHGPTLLDYSWDGTYNGAYQEIGNYTWRVNIVGCPNNIVGPSNGAPYGNVLLIR
jgi:hypothetical protein